MLEAEGESQQVISATLAPLGFRACSLDGLRRLKRDAWLLCGRTAACSLPLKDARSRALSQVVLSFTLPFALIPLIVLTRRAGVMGDLVNSRRTNWSPT
jgi:hypothetical protein